MTASQSILSYPDCKEALERALKSTKGIRLTFKTVKEARRFALRVHTFRVLDRRDSEKIYMPDHSMYGHSPYDPLVVSLRENVVEIGPWILDERIVEEIE